MAEGIWLGLLGVALLAGILSGVPVLLAIAGIPFLLALAGSLAGDFDLAFLGAYPQRAFGVMTNGLLLAVPLFVLMGVLLERSAIAERMLQGAATLMGGSRRALVLSVLGIATLIAASTGIIGATIVMLGLISLPAMRRAGVADGTASGLICAAGTLGQIIPPSIVLVLLGDQISNAYLEAQQRAGNFAPDPVTVADLFAGALLPGLLLVALYAAYAMVALRGGPPTPVVLPKDRPPLSSLLGDLVPPVLLICAVLGAILAGVATPTEAAAVGVAGTCLIAAATSDTSGPWRRRLLAAAAAAAFGLVALQLAGMGRVRLGAPLSASTWLALALTALLLLGLALSLLTLARRRAIGPALNQAVTVSAMIFGIILAASMLSLVFRGFGGDDAVHAALHALPGDHYGMLLATLILIFFLGFILEFVEIVFIVVPIVGPVILTDVDPVWFAILIALNLQTSFLTPPFGFALFYYRSVAPPEITTLAIYRAVVPFVAIQLTALACVWAFPALATWLPSVLF